MRNEMTSLFIINIHENVTYTAQIYSEHSEARNHTARNIRRSIDEKKLGAHQRIRSIRFLLYAVLALITGCSNSTYRHVFENPAYKIVEKSAQFKHLVIESLPSATSPSKNSDELHIYIEGDGLPWMGDRPAADPTPRNPVALELLRKDKAAAIYLGRPCYFNHYATGADSQCDARYWTNARYSRVVVEAMNSIALRYIADRKPSRVVLIGYSGGGVLATMMACTLPQPVTLITLGANLDVTQWAALHNYSPLSLSLNPTNDFAPCAGLSQHHYAGANDEQVPVQITRTFTEKFREPLTVLPDVDHSCCWADLWPQLLAELNFKNSK